MIFQSFLLSVQMKKKLENILFLFPLSFSDNLYGTYSFKSKQKKEPSVFQFKGHYFTFNLFCLLL